MKRHRSTAEKCAVECDPLPLGLFVQPEEVHGSPEREALIAAHSARVFGRCIICGKRDCRCAYCARVGDGTQQHLKGKRILPETEEYHRRFELRKKKQRIDAICRRVAEWWQERLHELPSPGGQLGDVED